MKLVNTVPQTMTELPRRGTFKKKGRGAGLLATILTPMALLRITLAHGHDDNCS